MAIVGGVLAVGVVVIVAAVGAVVLAVAVWSWTSPGGTTGPAQPVTV